MKAEIREPDHQKGTGTTAVSIRRPAFADAQLSVFDVGIVYSEDEKVRIIKSEQEREEE